MKKQKFQALALLALGLSGMLLAFFAQQLEPALNTQLIPGAYFIGLIGGGILLAFGGMLMGSAMRWEAEQVNRKQDHFKL